MRYTAALTSINEHHDDGWWDTLTIRDEDGEDIESVRVRPSEEPEPYIAALRDAGWTVTGWYQRGLPTDWTVERA